MLFSPGARQRPRQRYLLPDRLLPVLLLLAAGLLVPGRASPEPRDPGLRTPDTPAQAPGSGFFGAEGCTECHQALPGFSHPVDVVPSMSVPEHLPLEEGRITCLTCHDGRHFRRAAATSGGRSDGVWGESGPGIAFCSQCHRGAGSRRRDMHAAATGKAHLLWGDARTQRILYPRPGQERVDPSRWCLGCHDGALAADASFGAVGQPIGPGGHPVDVRYLTPDRRIRRNLVPVGALDPRIRLENGRVTCGSCHSPYSPLESQLVMSNLRSRLCLACHDM